MDCGPASLKCVLDGHGLPVSYASLRDACHTDVDGTSIDTMETVANQLGLPAEQIVIPADHVVLAAAGALPAIAVVRLSDRLTHFVVLWRRHGSRVQVMDPASGRRWMRDRDLQRDLYTHRTTVPATVWREWAGSPEFTDALQARAREVGLRRADARRLVGAAGDDPSWRSLGALDAVLRMARALVATRCLRRGKDAAALIHRLFEMRRDHAEPLPAVPARFWSVITAGSPASAQGGPADEELVEVSGAVLVRFPRQAPAAAAVPADVAEGEAAGQASASEADGIEEQAVAARRQPRMRPFREMLVMLRADGTRSLAAVAAPACAAMLAVLVEAMLLNGLLTVGRELGPRAQRLAAMAAIVAFTVAVTVTEAFVSSWLFDAGRRLDTGLRMRFFARVPVLGDRYFQSRLTSDLAERVHSVHRMRDLPALAGRLLRLSLQLLATTIGIIWLDRDATTTALLLLAVVIALPLLTQPVLSELELRMRTHAGALSRYHLDALLGLVAIRAHGAERPLRLEHDRVLAQWTASAMAHLRASVTAEAAQALPGYAAAAWLVWTHLARAEGATSLLVPYWALSVPVLGEEFAALLHQYAPTRNVMLRLLEPLQAPVADGSATATEDGRAPSANGWAVRTEPRVALADMSAGGVTIDMEGIAIRAAGRDVLRDVTLTITPGEHVAIVGRSGAGKSTLVGLLLGWHAPSAGSLRVDGRPLDAVALARLRTATAWVDPAVHLWNRSLIDNVLYGASSDAHRAAGFAVTATGLPELIETLPGGFQGPLGEGGTLVSGGEGQRVRLGRALLREDARLVVLDEPCRGLDRDTRRALMAVARRHWRLATLLCVTHDIDETVGFDRVLVIEGGVVVEDGPPAELRERSSAYRELLAAERDVHDTVWSSPAWRHLELRGGRLHDLGAERARAIEEALA